MQKKLSVEIVIPVYNEEVELKEHVLKLHQFCKENLKVYNWHITIADNASTDSTPRIGEQLAHEYKEIDVLRLNQKGRGRAVKTAWKESGADICCYMDIDLSTDLKHLPQLISAIENGSDIAIGSRLLPQSKVSNRTAMREFISRSLNILIQLMFFVSISDVQCGFKGVSKNTVKELLPHIKDNEWFMDSELLIVGEKSRYTISQIPLVWRDNPGSTVRVLPTVMGDMKGLLRLLIQQPWKKLHRPVHL
ncbi:glycosyltransferase [Candidatus Roizmanbacteria bacterium]|nr:glycosyltransferase [Candidatus Roizmanbacteria bacterium]